MDIQVEIMPVAFDEMADRTPAEGSAEIRKRVMAAIGYRNLDRGSYGQSF